LSKSGFWEERVVEARRQGGVRQGVFLRQRGKEAKRQRVVRQGVKGVNMEYLFGQFYY
jgi:hypothetical protein